MSEPESKSSDNPVEIAQFSLLGRSREACRATAKSCHVLFAPTFNKPACVSFEKTRSGTTEASLRILLQEYSDILSPLWRKVPAAPAEYPQRRCYEDITELPESEAERLWNDVARLDAAELVEREEMLRGTRDGIGLTIRLAENGVIQDYRADNPDLLSPRSFALLIQSAVACSLSHFPGTEAQNYLTHLVAIYLQDIFPMTPGKPPRPIP